MDRLPFPDEPDRVAHELDGFHADLTSADQAGMTALASMQQLAAGEHMIMSNSSFSWWAAWMMHCRVGGYIIDPRSSNSLYQEPSWRALLMSNPLLPSPLAEVSQQLAKDKEQRRAPKSDSRS